MEKVLVTGASGFIGNYVIENIKKRDCIVHAVARSEKVQYGVNWHKVDLLEPGRSTQLIKKIRPDLLLHLAWETSPPLFWTSKKNFDWLGSSLEILSAFNEFGGRRIVFSGSCAEYERNNNPCSELDTKIEPTTLYGTAKNSLNRLAKIYCDNHGVDYAWGRVFNTFGPAEPSKKLIASIIIGLLKNQEVNILNKNQVFDFSYVEHVGISFTELLFSNFRGEVNIASGEPRSVMETALTIAQQLGREGLLTFKPMTLQPNENSALTADISLFKSEILNHEIESFEHCIAKTIGWWRTQIIQNNI